MTVLAPRNELQSHLSLLADFADIPTHDPARYETSDGFDNPSCTNGDRAAFATEALDTFQKICNMEEDVETAASDLICDLLHLLHANNRDPVSVLRNGIHGFLCEAGTIYEADKLR
jgi:hypothetical protein